MKIAKMRVGISESTGGIGIRKIKKVIKKTGNEKETLYDFRCYLIKDGILQPGTEIIREEIIAPEAGGNVPSTNGYTISYEDMLQSGEVRSEPGRLIFDIYKMEIRYTYNKVSYSSNPSIIIMNDDILPYYEENNCKIYYQLSSDRNTGDSMFNFNDDKNVDCDYIYERKCQLCAHFIYDEYYSYYKNSIMISHGHGTIKEGDCLAIKDMYIIK